MWLSSFCTVLQLIAEKAAAEVARNMKLEADQPSQQQQQQQKNKDEAVKDDNPNSARMSVSWTKMQIPCMLPAVTDDTSSSDDDKSSKKAYPKPAGSTPKSSYTADESPLRNRAFVANKK